MKYLKKPQILSYILPFIAVLIVAFGYPQISNKTKMQVCNHEYALCTSAKCIPLPGDLSKAICTCDVKEGKSMATAPCDTLQPSKDANGIRTLYSTFSFEQFSEGKKSMRCPNGTPWTWCLNKHCTVDPSNPQKAICVCDVLHTGEWTTLGGDCDTSSCSTGYWSGATMQDDQQSSAFLAKALGLNKSPAKWCGVVSK